MQQMWRLSEAVPHNLGLACTDDGPDPKALRAPPLILKYAGVKSWSAFFRNASMWGITEDDGVYKILNYRKHPKGHYQQDPAQEIQFPAGTTVNDVVDRTIAILQEAAPQ